MALKGIKVLEFAGLAPGPFCGKILADFGATVTRIDKVPENAVDVLQAGKNTLAINLKAAKGQQLVRQLAANCDVLIEPFRPGIMEKLNLGPEVLCADQPRLIYARLTGFGQSGAWAKRAGHDINYVAMSGVLSMLGRRHEPPTAPVNLLADFAGGGLMCALGICMALLERHRSGRGQVVDAAMVDGAAYVASWLFMTRTLPFWGRERGMNVLDTGAYYYDTYRTKDDKYMSVGALEPQFFEIFKNTLGLQELTQFTSDDADVAAAKAAICDAFLQKTQAEWTAIFKELDACVCPVLEWQEAMDYEHNKQRDSFQCIDDVFVPKPAPRLSRTPGQVKARKDNGMEAIVALLKELKLDVDKHELQKLVAERVIMLPTRAAKL